jgi:hypothetical protein
MTLEEFIVEVSKDPKLLSEQNKMDLLEFMAERYAPHWSGGDDWIEIYFEIPAD